jgi:hypothetical protein
VISKTSRKPAFIPQPQEAAGTGEFLAVGGSN